MKVIEILKFKRELMKRLYYAGVRLEDAQYIDLYSEYSDMVAGGDKVSYAVAFLADKYKVSERKVYGLIKRFRSDCKTVAV